MTTVPMKRVTLLASLVLAACSANANMRASTADGVSADGHVSAATETEAAPPAPVASAASTTAPPSTTACPIACSYAEGANFKPVTGDDADALTKAFSPTFARFAECTPPHEGGPHARASVTLNVRFDAEGHVSDVGLDPHGKGGHDSACYSAVPLPRPEVTMAGATTVRCAERCEHPDLTNAKTGTKRARGRK